MPSFLYAGGRLDSVSVITGAPTEVTTAGSFDSAQADCSLLCAPTDVFQVTFLDTSNNPVDATSGSPLYLHFEMYSTTPASTSVTQNVVTLVDSSGNPWLALRANASSGTLGLYYNSGSGASPTWTQIGSATYTYVNFVRVKIDIKLTFGSPHAVEWSVNSSLLQAGTFTQASLTALRGARFAGLSINLYPYFSQICATTGRSTINAVVKTLRASGAGGNSGWTGAYTNVNEAVNSDATFDAATTAGLRQTYAMADITLGSGYNIGSVFHFLRAKNDGSTPANIKSSVRESTTNYDGSANLPGIGTSFAPLGARYDTDPGTSAAWTQTGLNAAEFGYLSAT